MLILIVLLSLQSVLKSAWRNRAQIAVNAAADSALVVAAGSAGMSAQCAPITTIWTIRVAYGAWTSVRQICFSSVTLGV